MCRDVAHPHMTSHPPICDRVTNSPPTPLSLPHADLLLSEWAGVSLARPAAFGAHLHPRPACGLRTGGRGRGWGGRGASGRRDGGRSGDGVASTAGEGARRCARRGIAAATRAHEERAEALGCWLAFAHGPGPFAAGGVCAAAAIVRSGSGGEARRIAGGGRGGRRAGGDDGQCGPWRGTAEGGRRTRRRRPG